MPAWLAREVIRATTAPPPRPATPLAQPQPGGPRPAAYLATVINGIKRPVTGPGSRFTVKEISHAHR